MGAGIDMVSDRASARTSMYRCINTAGAAFLLSLALLSCATQPPPGYYNEGYGTGADVSTVYTTPGGIRPGSETGGVIEHSVVLGNTMAVLGIVASEKKMRDFQRKNLAIELETRLRVQDSSTPVIPYSQVKSALRSNGQHRLMLDRYRINGRLTEADWGVLRASGMAARYVVVARIDRDETEKFEPRKIAMKNSHGDTLSDRQQVTLMHRRSVEVAARVYDLTTGNEVWSGAYVSEPANQTSYTEYTGSSFTGSMATLLTNSFTNGRSAKKYPPAPSATEALREAFSTIAAAVAGRSTSRAAN